jgi:tRNA(Ile2) C34 agmatinyltransferase TiaS
MDGTLKAYDGERKHPACPHCGGRTTSTYRFLEYRCLELGCRVRSQEGKPIEICVQAHRGDLGCQHEGRKP